MTEKIMVGRLADWSKWVIGVRWSNRPFMRFLVIELGPWEIIWEWEEAQ